MSRHDDEAEEREDLQLDAGMHIIENGVNLNDNMGTVCSQHSSVGSINNSRHSTGFPGVWRYQCER
jgi:hypothetical protein